jgi:phage tail-like protein
MSDQFAKLLVRLEGVDEERQLELTTDRLTIGRLPGRDLVLDHPKVSREHAELQRDAQGWRITDLKSSNGTLVNGQPLDPFSPRLLVAGDRIQIGAYILTYVPAQMRPAESDEPAEVILEAAHTPQPETREAQPAEQPIADSEAADGRPRDRTSEPKTSPRKASSGNGKVPEHLPVMVLPRLYLDRPDMYDSSRYLQNLPTIFHDTDFLRRYLLIFEALWEPLEYREDHIQLYFDPKTMPSRLLPWLAGWFDLALNPHWPEWRKRQLLTEVFELYRWRGTRYGLTRMLEVCTGLTPLIIDLAEPNETGKIQPFMILVRLEATNGQTIDAELRTLVDQLVRLHKPAHVGYTLEFSP